ncbi:MAG: hypothetical protein ABIQ65_15175 [Thermoanaerobaculia bacterium]
MSTKDQVISGIRDGHGEIQFSWTTYTAVVPDVANLAVEFSLDGEGDLKRDVYLCDAAIGSRTLLNPEEAAVVHAASAPIIASATAPANSGDDDAEAQDATQRLWELEDGIEATIERLQTLVRAVDSALAAHEKAQASRLAARLALEKLSAPTD